jgi:hypothetical protein
MASTPPDEARRSDWGFTIPRTELVQHVAQRRSNAEIGRLYGVHRSQVTRAIRALTQEELAQATLRAMAVKAPARALVRPEPLIEPVDAAETLLASVHGLRRIQEVFRQYIEEHRATLTSKKHRAALALYMESAKALAKVVHELVVTQGKLAEWVGAEELRKLVVTTFDRLPARLEALGKPVTPLEAAQMAKALYLEELQGRIVLLRQGRRLEGVSESGQTHTAT